MRLLDGYLLRTFVMPWLTCLLGFSFLFVIVDLVESLEGFVDNGVSGFQMALYYLRFLPSIWNYVGPITLLLGLLYALYHLTRNNEVIAMRASGISLYRVLFPFIVLGVVISIFSTWISTTVAPRNLAWTDDFFARLGDEEEVLLSQLRFKEPEAGRTWDIETLNPVTGDVTAVTVWQKREDGSLEYVLTAETAFFRDDSWFFRNVILQQHSKAGYPKGRPEERELLPKPTFTESPERIVRDTKPFEFLTSGEIKSYLQDRESLSEKTLAHLRTELQMRRGHPWLCLVTILLAVPFGTTTARKGVFRGVAACLLLFFGLYFLMNFFKAMGLGQKVDPWVAGWAPTLIFGGVGAFLLRRLR